MSSSCKCDCQGESPSSAGSTPKPSRRYEVGDEVELTVRIVQTFGEDFMVRTVGVELEGITNWMRPCQLDAGRLKPRPIKVGDLVTFPRTDGVIFPPEPESWVVVAIVEDRAWLDARLLNFSTVVPVSQLVKV